MHTISHVTSRTPLAVCVPTDGYRTGAQATASVPQSDRSPLPRSQVLIPEPFAGAACSKPAGIQCRPASPEMVTTVFELLLSAQSLFSSPGCCKPETSLSITSVTAAKQPRASAKHSRRFCQTLEREITAQLRTASRKGRARCGAFLKWCCSCLRSLSTRPSGTRSVDPHEHHTGTRTAHPETPWCCQLRKRQKK